MPNFFILLLIKFSFSFNIIDDKWTKLVERPFPEPKIKPPNQLNLSERRLHYLQFFCWDDLFQKWDQQLHWWFADLTLGSPADFFFPHGEARVQRPPDNKPTSTQTNWKVFRQGTANTGTVADCRSLFSREEKNNKTTSRQSMLSVRYALIH